MQDTKLPEYLFISSTDGGLYDTRIPDWSRTPLRREYRGLWRRDIETTHELRAAMRQRYVWPGGYELVFVTDDGGLLCCDCVRKHYRSVAYSMRHVVSDGWRVVAAGYEAVSADCARDAGVETCYCDHCAREFGEIA